MKKNVILMSLLLATSTIYAQDEFDALKVAQPQLQGTARYMSMGGAFTALGGDPSAISLNPAGLGVYKSSELSATLNVTNNSTSSIWNGENSSNNNNLFANLNNFSVVLSIPTADPDYSSAFSFTYDRLKSFNRSGTIAGGSQLSSITDYIANRTNGISESALAADNAYSDAANLPWLSVLAYDGWMINPSSSGTNQWSSLLNQGETVNPTYSFNERGYVDQYSLSYGANISNLVYWGASIGWQSLSYTLTTNYQEAFSGGGSMNLQNQIYTTGNGFDFKLGVIVRPTDFLRLGASVKTPTFYTMTDYYYAGLSFPSISGVNNGSGTVYTPAEGGYSKYELQTPWVFNFGLAGVISNKGVISVDYQYQDYSSMKYSDENGDSFNFSFENQGVKDNMQGVSTFKIGGEYRVTDQIALRLGYNYISPATKTDAYRQLPSNSIRTDSEYFLDVNTQNFTGGIGYHYNNWNFDLAYVLNTQKQKFYPYDDASLVAANVTTKNSNIVFTIGVRY
jgi:hypothetical protein